MQKHKTPSWNYLICLLETICTLSLRCCPNIFSSQFLLRHFCQKSSFQASCKTHHEFSLKQMRTCHCLSKLLPCQDAASWLQVFHRYFFSWGWHSDERFNTSQAAHIQSQWDVGSSSASENNSMVIRDPCYWKSHTHEADPELFMHPDFLYSHWWIWACKDCKTSFTDTTEQMENQGHPTSSI